MSRSRTIQFGAFGGIIAVLGGALVMFLLYANIKTRRLARRAQATMDMANYRAALMAYSNHFGVLPAGNNAAVTPILTGSYKQQLIFLNLRAPSKFNSRGEFLDPNGHPYDIEVTTNRVLMLRAIEH